MPGTNGQVLHFGRPGGWQSVTNFGSRPVPVPRGTVVVASGPLQDGLPPADTTAWLIPAGHRFPGVEAPEATSSGAWLVYYDPAGKWAATVTRPGRTIRPTREVALAQPGDVAQARVVPHDLGGVRDE
jgi:hypothetical protein